MLLFIAYKDSEGKVTHSGKYTSQAHREYFEQHNPELSGLVAEDISAVEIRKIKKIHREDRFRKHLPGLIAEIGLINEDLFAANQLDEAAYESFQTKIALVKRDLIDEAFDFAIVKLQALDIAELPPEVKSGFIAMIQGVLDAEQAELNPPDSHLPAEPA